jgi:membrane complex biogenesis BtpA family protein
MVHLPALPGAAGARLSMAAIIQRACGEARTLVAAGFDAVVVENYGDAPFHADHVPAETVAAMAVIASRVAEAAGAPIGINVLRNDALAGLAVAAVTGAAFIRVNVLSGVYATDQGVITGRAADVARTRARLCPQVRIAADVHVKHAVPISQPDIGRAAADTAYRGMADMLIVSGQATGMGVDIGDLRRVRQAVPDRPLWVGSGVTHETARDLLEVADGLIVGTCLKRGGRTTAPLDPASIKKFIRMVKG